MLSPRQKEAVEHGEGPLLVVAGAGSGKTRVLTHRVAYLIGKRGVPPHQVLAITFTNKAAGEMKSRLKAMLPDVTGLWVCTFHAAGARILRREIEVLGYRPDFVIYDEADQLAVIREGLKVFDWDEKAVPPRSLAAGISEAKNRLQGPSEYGRHAATPWEKKIAAFFPWYQKRLQENNALDFDDLLWLTILLFRRHPEILSAYQERFRYILVDEYQDTNHAQYVLVNLLAARYRNLFVVGDPDQSIYSWRGANLYNILNFKRDYPEAREIKLEENYRSTGNILQAANHLVRFNRLRLEKALRTTRPPGSLLVEYAGEDEREEAWFVAREIEWLHRKEKRPYSSFAVFYRTHAQSRVLEDYLLHLNIPYRIVGGVRFYQRKEIKDLVAYLRLLANPQDNMSLLRIINVPRRGIGEATLQQLTEYAQREGLPLYSALVKMLGEKQFSGRARTRLEAFAGLIEELRQDAAAGGGITPLARKVLEKTGYLKELEADPTEEGRMRIENLQEFLSVTAEYDAQGGFFEFEEDAEFSEAAGSLGHFLAQIALLTDLDSYREGEEAVVLMTMHAAKGLEFPIVFVTGMEEGIFPLFKAQNSEEELEEERRLCYVAITRAKERVYLTRARCRNVYGQPRYYRPSRFLDEIPEELKTGVPCWRADDESLHQPRERQASGGCDGEKQPQALPEEFEVGDRVVHAHWGEGVVVQVKGEGEERQAAVAFPDRGVKNLLLKYAPLRKAVRGN